MVEILHIFVFVKFFSELAARLALISSF